MDAISKRVIANFSDTKMLLGSLLTEYKKMQGYSDSQLADFFAVSMEDLNWLSACLLPREENFLQDVREIETKFKISVGKLASVVKFVESLDVMKLPSKRITQDSGLFMAARKKKSTKKNSKNKEKK
jgi:hypothetical protein